MTIAIIVTTIIMATTVAMMIKKLHVRKRMKESVGKEELSLPETDDSMIQEIKYGGQTSVPSDYECPDGDLSCGVNMLQDNGVVKPLGDPVELNVTVPTGYKLAYVHASSNSKRFILTNGSAVRWVRSDNSSQNGTFSCDADVKSVSGVGNTLLLLTANGVYYVLWKNNTYNALGYHIPELPISFGLQGELCYGEAFRFAPVRKEQPTNLTAETDGKVYIYDASATFQQQVMPAVDKWLAENSVDAGKFAMPFLVRYAYRLYDGSLSMHSAPVLMMTSSRNAAHFIVKRRYDTHEGTYGLGHIVGIIHELDYCVIDSNAKSKLSNWDDVVQSVDVFISKPIYNIDVNGEIDQNNLSYNTFGGRDDAQPPSTSPKDSISICKLKNSNYYSKVVFSSVNTQNYGNNSVGETTFFEKELPDRDEGKILDDILSAQFYLLKSIPIAGLATERTKIEVEKGYLGSLTSREVMTDDWLSHDQLIPDVAFGYNSRLHMAGLKRRLFNGFRLDTMMCYRNSGTAYPAKVVILTPYGRVESETSQVYGYDDRLGLFVYYPCTGCGIVYISYQVTAGTSKTQYAAGMSSHPHLNGSYAYNSSWNQMPSPSGDDNVEVPMQTKVYVSEVNNPFVFPARYAVTVGEGNVKSIAAAARPLSEGQFGQFPLYAFTDEGVWSLETSDTGVYTARQPITRDVCVNAGSITSLDNEVLFATDRGIMLLSGRNSVCISDAVSAGDQFSVDILPNLSTICQTYNIGTTAIPSKSFLEFIKKGGMTYDYVHQRVLVWNPDEKYAYVYSLKDKSWGVMSIEVVAGSNSYPDAFVTVTKSSGRKIVNLCEDKPSDGSAGSSRRGMLVTRPLKLGAPNTLKTVRSVIERGKFRKGSVKHVLYGSRDLYNWFMLDSSRDHYLRGKTGTPFKYFRVAVLVDMRDDESLWGVGVEFVPRMVNKIR